MQFTFRELIYAHFYNVKILHVSWLIVQELYFFTSPLRQRAPRYAPYLGRAEFRDSVCRHRDVAHDKSVPVHRVTQYFRGRLANKGAGEQGKVHGEGRRRWRRRRR